MQFKDGADVYTADGHHAGSIERVVIEPSTKEVTHLIVEKGFLFTEDKVVPMSLVGPATEDRVTLRKDVGNLEKLPDFEESHYVTTEPVDRPPEQTMVGIGSIYWYPPVDSRRSTGIFDSDAPPGYVEKTVQNIPEGTVALKEGSRVITTDDEHVGNIEQVFTDMPEGRVTHVLISQGLILKERKLIPVTWISSLQEEQVRLHVSSQFVQNLPTYQGSE